MGWSGRAECRDSRLESGELGAVSVGGRASVVGLHPRDNRVGIRVTVRGVSESRLTAPSSRPSTAKQVLESNHIVSTSNQIVRSLTESLAYCIGHRLMLLTLISMSLASFFRSCKALSRKFGQFVPFTYSSILHWLRPRKHVTLVGRLSSVGSNSFDGVALHRSCCESIPTH